MCVNIVYCVIPNLSLRKAYVGVVAGTESCEIIKCSMTFSQQCRDNSSQCICHRYFAFDWVNE